MYNSRKSIMAVMLAIGLSGAVSAQNQKEITTSNDTTAVAEDSGLLDYVVKRKSTSGFDPNAKWYDRIKFSGYVQARHNGIIETNPDLEVPQMDGRWGADQGFSLRRVRWKMSGWLHDRVFFYTQIDAAHKFTLKDAYIDVYFDRNKTIWARTGQSKVQFGYENMQSSSNRVPLDRTDGINSAFPGERDMGIALMYAPKQNQAVYKYLKKENLKHNGNYGTFSLAAYNGQTTNKEERNESLHIVGRASWPFMFANDQILEVAAQAYTGKYVVAKYSEGMTGLVKNPEGDFTRVDLANHDFRDARVGGTVVWYPQPIGFQAEWNWGVSPEYDVAQDAVMEKQCHGGYAMLLGRIKAKKQTFMPFARYMYYDGGKKHELDARSYNVNDLEIGVEWRMLKALELTVQYSIMDREYVDHAKPVNAQKGQVLRAQLQVFL